MDQVQFDDTFYHVAISWEEHGSRFHIWYCVTRATCAGSIKNPPRRALTLAECARQNLIEAAIATFQPDATREAADHDYAATLARYAPLRTGAGDDPDGARTLFARDGSSIADCDNSELARLIVHCVNSFARERVDAMYKGSAANV